MKPTQHAIISAGVGLLLAHWLQSWTAALTCFISGVLIDIDHHLDYYLTYKKFPWRYKDLAIYCQSSREGKMYLFLHSYEFLIVLWTAILYGGLGAGWNAVALGISVHVVCDQFANPLKPLAYFFAYRLRYGFERKNIFQESYWDKMTA